MIDPFTSMNTYRARRATTDDVAQLLALWKAAQLPGVELEKQFTDFQVVEDDKGNLVAATAMQISAQQGKIHSETFADFALTNAVRPLLWERFQVVAKNNGLYRLWTDETAPFWKKEAGFAEVSETQLHKLPEGFGNRHRGWTVLELREEFATPEALEQQFQLFKQTEELHRNSLIRQAKVWQVAGILIAGLVFAVALYALVTAWKRLT